MNNTGIQESLVDAKVD